MKVMKFGGGCLDGAEAFRAVGRVVKGAAKGGEVAVVISAIQGVTDQLHRIIPEAIESDAAIQPFLKKLVEQHSLIVREIVADAKARDQALSVLKGKAALLERCLFGVAYTEEATPRLRDYITSYGERLAAVLLAAHLASLGLKAVPYDGDELGLLTDGVYGNATPLLDAIEKTLQQNLAPEMKNGLIPVITGYFGCGPDGSVTTFGRGGSDYSAAIIAYGLGADSIEVWKDVPGFMSADPKFVPEARYIEHISYNEVAELAYYGAKILHPRIVEPAALRDIPIVIKSLLAPDEKGTLITKSAKRAGWIVQSIAAKSDIALVGLYGPAMAYTSGLASQVFDVLGKGGINVYAMTASMASFSLVIDGTQGDKAAALLDKVKDGVIHRIEVERDVTLVSLVGEGLRETKGIAARTFSALLAADVNVELVSDGGSDIALAFIIRKKDAAKAVKALHGEFIGKG